MEPEQGWGGGKGRDENRATHTCTYRMHTDEASLAVKRKRAEKRHGDESGMVG